METVMGTQFCMYDTSDLIGRNNARFYAQNGTLLSERERERENLGELRVLATSANAFLNASSSVPL